MCDKERDTRAGATTGAVLGGYANKSMDEEFEAQQRKRQRETIAQRIQAEIDRHNNAIAALVALRNSTSSDMLRTRASDLEALLNLNYL